jgi:hypothetical protein
MKDAEAEATDFTLVTLQVCKKQCRSYLKIVYFWEKFDEELEENMVEVKVKSEGFLVSRRTKIWQEILTPVKLSWIGRLRRKLNW